MKALRTTTIILAIVCLPAVHAISRVGETKSACETRYGTPQDEYQTKTMFVRQYKKSGLQIFITFSDDSDTARALAVRYVNWTSPPDTNWVTRLLDANAQDQEWVELKRVRSPFFPTQQTNSTPTNERFRDWKMKDDSAHASLKDNMLEIETQEYKLLLSERTKQLEKEAKQSLEDF